MNNVLVININNFLFYFFIIIKITLNHSHIRHHLQIDYD